MGLSIFKKRFTGKAMEIAAITVALALVLSTPVQATFEISVTVFDTANTATFYSNVIQDGGAGDTDGVVNGQILLGNGFQPLPGFVVQGSFHQSKLGGANLLTSGSSSVTNSNATTYGAYVAVGDIDFKPPVSVATVTGSGTFTNAIGSTIALGYYDDPENVQGASSSFLTYAAFLAGVDSLTPGNQIGSFPLFTASKSLDSYSYNQGGIAVNDLDPFSMTLLFYFNLTPGGELTSRGQAMQKNLPEPATMLLLGLGLVGLAGVRRFRK